MASCLGCQYGCANQCTCQASSNAPRYTEPAAIHESSISDVLNIKEPPRQKTKDVSTDWKVDKPSMLFLHCNCPAEPFSEGGQCAKGMSRQLGILVHPVGHSTSSRQIADNGPHPTVTSTQPGCAFAPAPGNHAPLRSTNLPTIKDLSRVSEKRNSVERSSAASEIQASDQEALVATQNSSGSLISTQKSPYPLSVSQSPITRAFWSRTPGNDFGTLVIKEGDTADLIIKVPIPPRANPSVCGISINIFLAIGSAVLAIVVGRLLQFKAPNTNENE